MNDNLIKMFIGGEEVVSNKEFTINEEMLSASSTILNNCYPASWEESKDYVSNFYYPKDYSKFILGKGNFTYGTEQYTIFNISGNNFMEFTTNVEKDFAGFTIYGNTTQETRSGKNLFNKNGTYYSNGSTSEPLNTGVKVTTTVAGNYKYASYKIGGSELLGKVITLTSNMTASANNIPAIFVYIGRNGNNAVQLIGSLLTNGSKTITIPSTFPTNTNSIYVLLYSNTNGTNNVGDYVDYTNLQVEIGNTSTSYESFGVMPSPDYPSPLISVGYQNLFNKNTAIENSRIIHLDNGLQLHNCWATNVFTTNSNEMLRMFKPNTTYFISAKIKIINRPTTFDAHQNSLLALYHSPPYTFTSMITLPNKETMPLNEEITITQLFTTPDYMTNVSFISYCFYTNATYGTGDIIITDILLTEGRTQHSYIPYGKYGIEIKAESKNLINNNLYGNYFITSVSAYNAPTYIGIMEYLRIKPNTTYTISSQIELIRLYFVVYDISNNAITQFVIANGKSVTFTTPSNAVFYRFSFTKDNTPMNINDYLNIIQLEYGTQATNYQPFNQNSQIYLLDDSLKGIGNVNDKLYVENDVLYLERKIGNKVLNGSENWGTIGNNGYYTAFPDKRGLTQPVPCLLMCNYFKATNNAGDVTNIGYMTEGYYTIANYNVFFNYNGVNTDLAGFKQWLSTHNLNVQYVLATPTVEELGAIELPVSYNGINNVEINTGIDTTSEIDYYWKNYDVLFAGIVKNSGDISLRPTDPKYCSLQILDYKTFLSESDTLDFVISDKTIAEAISMVVDAIRGYGFILGTINISQADDIIGAYSTLNKTAYDVFQYLANISGSRWRARFVDSDTMAIDFYDPELLPRANDIDYTQQYWEDNKIVDLTFNYGTRDYRNKQIILSDEVYGGIDYTEVLLSNGYGTSYITQNNIANITSITVNGVEAEVITQSEKDLGVDADFYYTPGKNVVESTTSYTAGTQIIITYTPLVKGRQIVYNDEEVTRIATQTNTTGVISRYENRNDILSSDELENIAETYIKYKGKPEIILKLTTLNNDLFSIGEICYFNSPIADLAQDYMVKSKATNYTSVAGETNIFYTYELTSSFNSEKAINYFDNQRNKATGNIAEGESITRNIDINNSAMIIWENATITEISVSVDGDNALNSVLNSPFIQ